MNRGDAAAATWIVRGDEIAATPRPLRGYSVAAPPRPRRGSSADPPRRGRDVEIETPRRYGGGNARDRAAADLGFVADETYGDAEGLALRSDLIDCHVDVCSLELLFRYSENFDYQASRGHFVPSEVGNAELGQRVYAHVLGATGGRGARVPRRADYASTGPRRRRGRDVDILWSRSGAAGAARIVREHARSRGEVNG